MYKVYWTEQVVATSYSQAQAWLELTGEPSDTNATVPVAKSKSFDTTELTSALAFAEELRTARRNGALYSFVALVAEDPNSVGEAGVSDKLPDGYDWTKQDRAGKSRRRQ